MEKHDLELNYLNVILNDYISYFCHMCIEKVCNEALRSVVKLKIEPSKAKQCYLRFLKEKILNLEIECKNRILGCKEKIMFGELKQHLSECKYNPVIKENNKEKEQIFSCNSENIICEKNKSNQITCELSNKILSVGNHEKIDININNIKYNNVGNKKKKGKK
jgi:hypothetical protein